MSALLKYRISSDLAVIASVTGVTFLSSFFNGAVTVLLPTIQRALDIADDELVWPISIYSLTLACFLPLAGRLADVFGRRTVFLLGSVHFAVFTLAFALSPNFLGLTLFAALLGFGPAAFTPAATGIIGFRFEGRTKATAFACLGMGQPLGFILGLFTAAFLAFNWRIIFFVQAAVASVFIISSWISLPPNQEVAERDRSIDWTGAFLSTSGLILLNFAVTDSQSAPLGWKTPYIIALLPISIVLLISFYFFERRLEKINRIPMIAPSLFKTPFVLAILSVAFFAWLSFNTAQYWINLYMQNILNYTPVESAIAFLPLIISGSILNVIPALLISHVRGSLLILGGLILILPSAILFAEIDVSASYWAMLFPALVLLPGPDLAYTVASVQISLSVDPRYQAMAGALFNVSTRLATSLGLAFSSTLANSVTRKALARGVSTKEGLLAGYQAAGYLCCGSVILAIILTLFFCLKIGVIGKMTEEQQEQAIELEPTTRIGAAST